MARMDYIDDAVSNMEEKENRDRDAGETEEKDASNKIEIGRVAHFFDRINVAAIELTGSLRVGDTIEIGESEESFTQRVTSMQINKREVKEARSGDDVGIKVERHVRAGSAVYRLM